MSNWLWPIKVLFKLKADLTKPAEDITGMAKDTHKGVGKFFYALLGPWIEERIGKAKRGAAQAEKDSLDILAGHARLDEETKTMISIGNVSSVDALCEELEKANSQCKAKRLAAALMAASIEMKQVPEDEVADEPLNQTFFNHWRAEAELIDDEDLRQWWAHLLVEETKKPNSISPRTLDVVKNLSKSEAKLFEKLSVGIIEDCSLFIDDDGTSLLGSYSDVLILQDAGLISSRRSTLPIDKQKVIFSHGMFVVELLDRENHEISCHALTVAGQELCRILCNSMILDSELYEFAEKIKNICKCNVNLFKIDSKTYIPGTSEVKIKCADKPLHQTLYWEEI